MKVLYPDLEPYKVHSIQVDKIHRLYVEECGNPGGIPVIFLHGGPASGCKPHHRCFFNPQKYRIFVFDQRGCGRSQPFGELDNNTSQHLVADIEFLRLRFNIDKWLLFGGSWGAALALLYAQTFADKVSALILRGIFLARNSDLEWFIKDGVNRIYPEQWQQLLNVFPKDERRDLINAMDNCLWGVDELAQIRAAREWDAWSAQVALGSLFDPSQAEDHGASDVLRRVRIELRYAKNQYFLSDDQILKHCNLIEHIPTIIIHGRNDLVCPTESAYRLHQHLPKSELIVLKNAGHVAQGNDMIDALVSATDNMANQLRTAS